VLVLNLEEKVKESRFSRLSFLVRVNNRKWTMIGVGLVLFGGLLMAVDSFWI